DSVLGMRRERAIRRMMFSIPLRLDPARENVQISGVLVEVDPETGLSTGIARCNRPLDRRSADTREP
ncbi:MAG: YmdB family metallophosphoesterase, partial [candidate division WOR-3 bacterium]